MEEIKEILNGYLRSKRKLKRIKIKLAEYSESLYSISCGCGDGMPRSSRMGDLSDRIAKKEELEILYRSQEEECSRILEKTCELIETLNSENEKDILTLRYIKSMSMNEIGVEIGYSMTSVQRMYRKAIAQLNKVIEKDSKWKELASTTKHQAIV